MRYGYSAKSKDHVMTELLILALAILPAVLLALFIYKRDPIPEPVPQLLKAFFYGVMISVPAVIVESLLASMFGIPDEPTSIFGAASISFIVAAFSEESLKLLALWLILRKNRFFDEHFDGIVYAVMVSLGFATIENVGYLFENIDDWMGVGVARALLAVPGHYAFGIIMGYYYSMYTFVKSSTFNRYMILAAPIIAHGIYDTIAFSMGLNEAMSALCMMLLIYFCYKLHKNCLKKIAAHAKRDTDPYSGFEA